MSFLSRPFEPSTGDENNVLGRVGILAQAAEAFAAALRRLEQEAAREKQRANDAEDRIKQIQRLLWFNEKESAQCVGLDADDTEQERATYEAYNEGARAQFVNLQARLAEALGLSHDDYFSKANRDLEIAKLGTQA